MNNRETKIIQAVIDTDKALDLMLDSPNDSDCLDNYNISIGKLDSLMFRFDYHQGINNMLDFNPDVVKVNLDKKCHYLIDSLMSNYYREKKEKNY